MHFIIAKQGFATHRAVTRICIQVPVSSGTYPLLMYFPLPDVSVRGSISPEIDGGRSHYHVYKGPVPR